MKGSIIICLFVFSSINTEAQQNSSFNGVDVNINNLYLLSNAKSRSISPVLDDKFLKDYWENSRGGDNLISVYWLYNYTGENWLLDLATKIDKNTANWRQKNNLPNWHNVNIAQSFRE